MLLLSYLRAEAERRAKENANANIIYAIEEPETAQHPDYQKKLIDSLIELSDNPMHQIIITTHTPEIVKQASDHFANVLSENICKGCKIQSCEYRHLQ